MKTIGFVKSKKENERRVAIAYEDISKINNKKQLFFEYDYFEDYGISNEEIEELGCNVVSREAVLKCDVICDPKIGDAEYLSELDKQTIFGWVHATQNRDITDKIINSKLTAFAWENMFEGPLHVFWENNQIAGAAAVLSASMINGRLPKNLNAAIIGYGNTGKGAESMLNSLGANVTIYRRKDEAKFKKEFSKFDIIVNAVLWDSNRTDHILYKKDLKKMKKHSMIVDVSCDHNGAIESSKPTTVEDPVFIVEGVLHYAVDHTPTLLFKDATKSISREVVKYINLFIEGKEFENSVIIEALVIDNGVIVDNSINEYQNR